MLSFISKYFRSISAIMAFAVWGGWAFYINHSLLLNERLFTGLAQGVFSLMVTLLMLKVVTGIYLKLPENIYRIIIPAIIIVMVTTILVVSIHYYIGTPQIFATVTPSLSVTFFYCLLTALKLKYESIEMDD